MPTISMFYGENCTGQGLVKIVIPNPPEGVRNLVSAEVRFLTPTRIRNDN